MPAGEPEPEHDPRLDPELLAHGDTRNVVDRYRYWRRDAIVADLDARRHPFHVAVENWQHDLNIGTVVRNANAFLAAAVHVGGRAAAAADRHRQPARVPAGGRLPAAGRLRAAARAGGAGAVGGGARAGR